MDDIPATPNCQERDSKNNEISRKNNLELDSEHSVNTTTPDDSAVSPAPEGGVRAWLVAAGGAAIFFSTLGLSNSFGTFEEYYLSHQLTSESPSKVSWIGSLALFLQFSAGVVAGPAFDVFGSKAIHPFALLYVFSIMMLSLCKSYWHFMLVQGVLMSVCMGMLQIPAFAAVSQYFEKHRAAALGLVVSGSSIGGVVIPTALSKMLNDSSLGFGWSLRVIGFVALPLMLFASVAIKERLPPRKKASWITSDFRQRQFLVLVASLFFMFVGMLTPFFYLPSYAVSKGMSPSLAGYLLAIINAASTFGRIIPGVLADKYGRFNIFSLGGLSTGVITFCMANVVTQAGFITYSVFLGFASGSIISGGSAAFSLCQPDSRKLGTTMGIGMALAGIGSLVGPPINGAIVNAYGGYFEVSMFSGAMCLFGGLLALLAKCFTESGILGRT
ncbi:hypothetical protein HIM_09738 [Hirsutella minnesotensis 3608]|uniref:Major facilitator superfamily (MFS) profile domain-containing protein n=1 Tax=Hirsutella minnesotensis 3608 TaxID=1043627 RepID=A0A0F7ZS75_9HYPO|nr:hypothetical protein HIM_09738 [Hirsutella minnesotensis 3608]